MSLPLLVIRPRKRRRVGKTLRSVGGLCFDYLTQDILWEEEGIDRAALRTQFARGFEAVIREHEQARFHDNADVRRYGPVVLEGREGMPYYVRLTLRRVDGMPPASWPDATAIWIDFHPTTISVRVRDQQERFWQSLKSALDRLRKARK